MHRPLSVIAMSAAFVIAFASAASAQTTRTVCASGCQYTSINAAIDDAQNGDVIQLSAETYFESSTIDTLGKAITIRGTVDVDGLPTSILDGGNPQDQDGTSGFRVLQCVNGETVATTFENLVIQNGYSSSYGRGMYNDDSSPTLTNCTLGWWGTDVASADFNQDGMVDGADLSYVLGYWGSCSTP